MLGKFVYSVTMETNSIKSFCVALDVLVRRAGHVRLQGETATTWEATTKMLCHASVAYTLFLV